MRALAQKHKAILIALFVGLLAAVRYCGHDKPDQFQPVITPLKADESLRVNVKRDQIKIIRRNMPDINTSTRNVEISVKEDGRVVVKERKWGFTFEPGIGFVICDRAGFAMNVQVLYVRQWGLDLGCAYLPGRPVAEAFKPYGAISYALPFRYTRNTSLFMGVTVQKDPIVGIKVRF